MQDLPTSHFRSISTRSELTDAIAPYFVGTRIANRSSRFCMNLRVKHLWEMVMFDVRVERSGLRQGQYGMSVQATAQHRFFAMFQKAGTSRVNQNGRVTTLNSGEWGVFEGRKPCSFQIADGSSTIGLILPEFESGCWSNALGTGGRMVSCSDDGDLAFSLLVDLAERSSELTESVKKSAERLLVELLSQAFEFPEVVREKRWPASDYGRLSRAKNYILAELTNSDLRPEDISRAIGVSSRSLFDLFARIGHTPMGYVRSQRLREAARRIRYDEANSRSMSHMAHELGFSDASHFSRLFRAQYGVTPRQWGRVKD